MSQKSRILVVEDSPTEAQYLRYLLEWHGYDVTVAPEGKEGLAAARTSKPNLIISDIIMPEINGYEMCHAIKGDQALQSVPVILLTQLSDVEDIVHGLEAGADYYLTKPFDEHHLLSRVEFALVTPVREKEKVEEGLQVGFGGKSYTVFADRQQMLNLLLSTYESAVERNRKLIETELELRRLNEQLEEMVEERTQELRDTQEQLVRREKLALLGQLAGGMAHELRNPLGAIKNAAYFLNMVLEEPEPEVKETLEILEKEVATSEKIISSLLDFARAKPPIRRKVDINEVVQEALSRTTVPENIEVVSQLDQALPAILADPDQLTQVFGNIILNGIQAMTEGGRLVVKTSEVSGKPPRSGWVAISFADTGVGIPEENLERIFEPLFTTKAKGIGLGLALAKVLVEGHGGSIEVESPSTEFIPSPALSKVEGEAEGLRTGEVGKGSTFTVRLPMGSRKEE